MKEIEDKVKREVKVTLKNVTLPNGASILSSQDSESKTSLPVNNSGSSSGNINPKLSISMNSSDKENYVNTSLEDERRSSIRKRIPINL